MAPAKSFSEPPRRTGSRAPSRNAAPPGPPRGRARPEALAFALRPDVVPPPVRHAVASEGSPLDRPTRSRFERAFRSGLGEVRVHDGPASERAARSVGTDAFALGPDVHLSRTAAEDEGVLAHEVHGP